MPKKEKPTSRKLSGNVLAFNISPKGHIEGALIETTDGPAQVNFPKHDAESLARSMRLGSKVVLAVTPEPDGGKHHVYTAHDDEGEASGTIVRLNYSLHGEVNGYHLDEGTFAHVKPEGAKKYKLALGDKVTVFGVRRAGKDATVVEVRALKKMGPHRDARAKA